VQDQEGRHLSGRQWRPTLTQLQLVEGGWKYTPSLDADDMTTCAYCNLALEGWESEDNPL
jgi:hypothetical protein